MAKSVPPSLHKTVLQMSSSGLSAHLISRNLGLSFLAVRQLLRCASPRKRQDGERVSYPTKALTPVAPALPEPTKALTPVAPALPEPTKTIPTVAPALPEPTKAIPPVAPALPESTKAVQAVSRPRTMMDKKTTPRKPKAEPKGWEQSLLSPPPREIEHTPGPYNLGKADLGPLLQLIHHTLKEHLQA